MCIHFVCLWHDPSFPTGAHGALHVLEEFPEICAKSSSLPACQLCSLLPPCWLCGSFALPLAHILFGVFSYWPSEETPLSWSQPSPFTAIAGKQVIHLLLTKGHSSVLGIQKVLYSASSSKSWESKTEKALRSTWEHGGLLPVRIASDWLSKKKMYSYGL